MKRKRTGTSYQDLVPHVQIVHAGYLEKLLSDDSITQLQMKIYFTSTKSNQLYGWLDFIVNGLMPFSYVEKPIILKHVRHEAPWLTTFMKYIRSLTEHVEQKIEKILPPKLALVFDGVDASRAAE